MKLKNGDYFSIPITEIEIGIGQIIELKKHSFYFVIFKEKIKIEDMNNDNIEKVFSSELLFFGETTDARLYHNIWRILGNKPPVVGKECIPYFKVKTLLGWWLIDYKGNKIQKISKEESNNYTYETSYSPIRFENALKAYYDIIPWNDSFSELFFHK